MSDIAGISEWKKRSIEKRKRRRLPLPCSSFLASCWVIYPHFGDAGWILGRSEEGRRLNSHFCLTSWVRTAQQLCGWCTTQLDIINKKTALCSLSRSQRALVVVRTVTHLGDLGAAGCCHPAMCQAWRMLEVPSVPFSGEPPATIHHPSWLSSNPNLGLYVRAASAEPGCPLAPLPPPPHRPRGLCVLKAHSFHSVKNKPACAPLQRRPSPQRPRVGCCCRSTRSLLK